MEGSEKQETSADVNWFGGKPSNSSRAETYNKNEIDETDLTDRPPATPRVPFEKFDLYYNMSGEKQLIIFNHFKYDKTVYFRNKQPSNRIGTDNDVTKLEQTFQGLGFTTKVHKDLSYSNIKDVMSEACTKDHKGTSCFAVVILTHGGDGEVYASDRPYQLNDIINLMQSEQSNLVGKPKLLFVQACRGGHMDAGRRVETDGGHLSIVLPTHSDTLIMRSSCDDYLSYRDSTGSWLMQSLCEVLDTYHQYYDLLQMLVLVNQAVAYKSTYTPQCEITANKKQMPETTHTMTKFLRFN